MVGREALVRMAACAVLLAGAAGEDGDNLVRNPGLEQVDASGRPVGYELSGDVAPRHGGVPGADVASRCVALDSAAGAGRPAASGTIAQVVDGLDLARGRWFRFAFRGLAQDGFAVDDDQLFMKVEFLAPSASGTLDGVTRKIYPQVERDRADLAVNGVRRRGGAAAWRTYALDVKVPFAEVDQLRLVVGFRQGAGRAGGDARFLIDDLSLTRIPAPANAPTAAAAGVMVPEGATLVPLGGRWSYARPAGESGVPEVFDRSNAGRLLYRAGRWEAPFAGNTTATLKAGFLDREGNVVESDRPVPDNVIVRFAGDVMIVTARDLPNHPVGRFPDRDRVIDGNPNYIQEMEFTFYVPLRPEVEPRAIAMDANNRNGGLPTACGTAIAANGVLFHNPYDAGMSEAVDIMDRCCGHPSPDNRYHYHKYPVCVKSPWADEGHEHSPLIGWAFDGFPIYGPYERRGTMARDDREHPLDAFNGHDDADRGWHYHVTPGKFPYVMGGYRGKVDPRNFLNEPGVRDMGGGPGLLPGPPMPQLNPDGDLSLSAEEIRRAPERLRALDRNGDGTLTRDELPLRTPPGGRPPFPPAKKKGGRPPGGPGQRPTPPAFVGLDTDGDLALSPREIAASADLLRSLDLDGDGALSRAEVQLLRIRRAPSPPR